MLDHEIEQVMLYLKQGQDVVVVSSGTQIRPDMDQVLERLRAESLSVKYIYPWAYFAFLVTVIDDTILSVYFQSLICQPRENETYMPQVVITQLSKENNTLSKKCNMLSLWEKARDERLGLLEED